MSKEIAQTVGGKRIAWLIAIVAAFAVFATFGTQWQKADAMEPTWVPTSGSDHYSALDAQTLNQSDSTLVNGQDSVGADSAIDTRQNATLGEFVGEALLSIHDPSRAINYAPVNPLNAKVARSSGVSPCHGDLCVITLNLSAISSLDPPTACFIRLSCATSNSMSIPTGSSSVTRDLVPTEGVLSSAMPGGHLSGTGSNDNAQGENSASDNSNDSVWLYAVLGLGALAFGVGGAVAARRSRP